MEDAAVEARIRHREPFERLFSRPDRRRGEAPSVSDRRKPWAALLTARAGGAIAPSDFYLGCVHAD